MGLVGWPSRRGCLGCDDGTIEVRAETPSITEVQGGSGRAGDVFQVVGEYFDHDGLAVTVCDQPADATLRGDGVTIDVTAPECPDRNVTVEDCRDVVVATVRGSDTDRCAPRLAPAMRIRAALATPTKAFDACAPARCATAPTSPEAIRLSVDLPVLTPRAREPNRLRFLPRHRGANAQA